MNRRYSRALITGINGQDGAWLAAQLLGEGVEVIGTHRPTSPAGNWRLKDLGFAGHRNLHMRALDASSPAGCRGLISEVAPKSAEEASAAMTAFFSELSANRPANPQLSEAQMDELIKSSTDV